MPNVQNKVEDGLAADIHLLEAWLRRQCWWSREDGAKDRIEDVGEAVKAVASDEGFSSIVSTPRRMHVGGYGARLDERAIACLLVGRVLDGAKPEVAVGDLRTLFRKEQGRFVSVYAFDGVTVRVTPNCATRSPRAALG